MPHTLLESNGLLLQQILSFLPIASMIVNKEGKILYFNLMAEHLTGYSQDEVIGKPCSQLEFNDCQIPCSMLLPDGTHNPSFLEGTLHHKKGEKRSVVKGIYPLKGRHGEIIGTLEVFIDGSWTQKNSLCDKNCLKNMSTIRSGEIHLRKLIERSKNKLLGIFDEIIDGLFMIDHEYKIKAVNKTQASYLKTTPKKLIEKYCYQVVAKRENPCPTCKVSEVFLEGTTKTDFNIHLDNDEKYLKRNQNSHRYINIHYIPIKTDLGEVHNVLIYIQDISKVKELEEEVRRTENLAGLGILASGVAHEINNPLQVILSGANCLIKKSDSREIVLEFAGQIKECAEKMANIIKELSIYSQGIRDDKPWSLIKLSQVLNDSISMASHVRNMKNITIHRQYQESGQILGNAGQFQQIFVNLLINATDAMEGMGEISLETFRENDNCCVIVKDTGVGIKEENLPYIFDPFFTTKEPGKGTGLGLNIVYRLVNQYEGKIKVKTKKGQGTAFFLQFPKATLSEVKKYNHAQ